MSDASNAATNEADLVFVGGTVITVDPQFSLAEALAVSGGRIAAVGSRTQVESLAGPQTRVVDLLGGSVLPGINDSHLHGAMLGAYWPNRWMDSMTQGKPFPTPKDLDTDDARADAIRRTFEEVLSVGITSYTEPGLGPGAKGQHGGSCDDAVMRVYKELAHQGEIPLRVTALSLFGQLDGPSNLKTVCEGIDTVEPPLFSGPTRWQVAGLKLFADIIPLNHGSWMSKPYGGGDCGHLVVEGDDDDERLASFREMIFHAHSAGLQVGVHATGDRAISETVRAFADAIDRDGRDDLRHYVIHGDLTPVETLELMGRTKTGINTQPAIHAIGAARRDPTAPPSDQDLMLRRAVDAGATLCLSSDGPIVTHDWRIAIAACLTRAAPAGSPEQKQRCISLEEAVRGYTINGAWQDHAERWKGSLEVGKVADLCVLSGDLTKTPAEEVPGLEVKMTVVDGEIAFQR